PLTEAAGRVAMRNDSFREGRADPGKRLDLGRRGGVEIDRRADGIRGAGWRARRTGLGRGALRYAVVTPVTNGIDTRELPFESSGFDSRRVRDARPPLPDSASGERHDGQKQQGLLFVRARHAGV